ncbi:hypothetical protein Lal_00004484 [Lupinus albus]|nr:hypothetical protein Lal_00004484 [Lupinus albus]
MSSTITSCYKRALSAFRPKKDDKYRIYWNIFHYIVGYATIALSIWNVFKGFDILQAQKEWMAEA